MQLNGLVEQDDGNKEHCAVQISAKGKMDREKVVVPAAC